MSNKTREVLVKAFAIIAILGLILSMLAGSVFLM
jgi:hypothetical protein